MSKFAIVGLSCLFPGAASPAGFWNNLRAGVDSRREGGEEVFGPAPPPGDADPDHRIYCARGGFVTDFAFDPAGYRLDADYLGRLDRLYHWTLHTGREALRDSGHAERPELLARTALVLGNYSFPTPASARVSLPLIEQAVLHGLRTAGLPGTGPALAGPAWTADGPAAEDIRVSGAPAAVAAAALGLGGPRYALDAACSSALYALKLACDHLDSGQADLALAGGVCAPDPTLIHLSFSDLHAYPENGFSQPFDAASGGILTGQGAGMLAVRRLADAVADGDRIYAVVDGIGLSNDGAGRHLLLPNPEGQQRAYEHAYAQAGVAPSDIDYLECHATGTPAGDRTELDSVVRFFGAHGPVPPIGSVKGNIGHLLTVAGLSSMVKVILAMRNGHIPPTPGVATPLAPGAGAGDDIFVRTGRDWPQRGATRRAAVSAFGFGGTNAHVVLSSPPTDLPTDPGTAPAAGDGGAAAATEALDVVGIGAHFGPLDSADAFERALFDGRDAYGPLPARRWRGLEQTAEGVLAAASLAGAATPTGAFADTVTVDPIDHRIPPADLRNYNLQHALVSKVADEALRDAGYSRTPAAGGTSPAPRRIGVVIAMEIEPSAHLHLARYGLDAFLRSVFDGSEVTLTGEQRAELFRIARDGVHQPIVANEVLSYIGNIMTSRISSLWNLTGPSFTISADGAGTAEALRVARLLLLDDTVESVLVGSVDLAGSPENLLLRAARQGAGDGPAEGGLAFGAGQGGSRTGEGAGAVVVTRPGAAARPAYARLESIAVRYGAAADGGLPRPDASLLADAAAESLARAGITAADIGYLEAGATGHPATDLAELGALAEVYPAGSGSVALGSAKAHLGHTGGAAEMAGLLRAVLCAHHGYLPGTPSWKRPGDEAAPLLAASSLYVPDASRPWLRRTRGARRYAAVSFIGESGAHGQLVVSAEHSRQLPHRPRWERAGGPLLLPLAGGSVDGLLAELRSRADELRDGADARAMAREAVHALPGGGRAPAPGTLRVVLVGADREELLRQAELALGGLPAAHAAGKEWSTPAGSFFTGQPLGPDAKVALVYPGAFNSYPGLGQDLFRAFPELLARFEEEAAEPDRTFRAADLYPRTQVTPGRRELMGLEAGLGDDLPFMLATGTTFANLYTDLVRDILGVPAHGAFGYSLGESSMLFATGGWERAARRDDRISSTPLFQDRLCGPRLTVRELWDVPPRTPDDAVWACHVLLTDAPRVRAAVARYERVFLTHVNTPTEVVIAGDPAQCKALIAELGCPAARSPVNSVMHCPVVDGELAGLAELNDHPVGSTGGLELLSAYDYAPIGSLDRATVAERIARTLRDTIDFPRLVETAYDRGYRYFIEVGPGATCTRWVHDSLGGRPHVAAGVDRRGTSSVRSLAALAARLAAHGLPVDLAALCEPAPRTAAAPARPAFAVGGGESIPERVAERARPLLAAAAAAPRTAPADRTAAPVLTSAALGPSGGHDRFDPPRPVPQRPAVMEEREQMPADPSLAEPEAIVFDGEPVSFLPWAVHESGPQPAPTAPPASGRVTSPPAPAVRRPAAPRTPDQWDQSETPDRPDTSDTPPAPGPDGVPSVVAELVRDVRRQMIDTHLVVMETQQVLQDSALSAMRSLLGPSPAAPPAPAAPVPALARPRPPAALPPAPAVSAPAPSEPTALSEPPQPSPAAPVTGRVKPDGVLWDQQDLLEFATGSLAAVFGPGFAEVDGYAKRVRLPAPPYHFVTRVTALDAETGDYRPSFIRTEYDVPEDAWYAVDGGVPPAVAIEAGQCDLLLISYLGIDFRNKGERMYRLLDSTLVFHGDLPSTGQTLRYDISINRFVRQGDVTLFFFSYLCYADGELILELKDACAGFFSAEELATPLGVVESDRDKARRAALTRTWFKPLARTDRDHLTAEHLELLAQGRTGEVFGPEHAQDPGLNPALRLPDARLRMIDEVTVDRTGGPRGIGLIGAVKHLDPHAWYFECHFSDDPVLAGSMVAEGAVQALQTYLLHQGMHLVMPDARFQTIIGLQTEVQVRGQITPEHSAIRYEIEVMELTMLPRPSVVADVLVYLADRPVIRMRNFGIQVREKPGTPYRPGAGGVPVFLGRRNRRGEPAMINELHLAHAAKGDLGTAMGPEFDIYGERRAPYIPNGDFQFVDRIMSLSGTRGDLTPGSEMVTEYDSPADAWYYRQTPYPHLPNAVLMETSLQAAILLGYYLGATLAEPTTEYRIRNLDGHATLVKDLDLRDKTVRHHSKLLMTSSVSGAVLQRFSYELSADGEVFYVGESLFGYFSDAALANQTGLDNGSFVPSWLETEKPDPARVRRIELGPGAAAFTDPAGGLLKLPGDHFDLVDRVDLVADGGLHGAGYLHGYRAVRDDEWYFDCHFHRDPVMPGSLGVEAVLQAMRLFVLEQGLAEGIERPRFALATDVETSWKYRGQILRGDGELSFDVHVKEVRRTEQRLVLIADAYLAKPGLRIYELIDVAVEVRPAG
ncbi:beta-ketoacyl synthase N-terminal-like domain-containing protein [Streptomyces polygonati]|uniref:Beta-ketoacyl synthase N-terminal-like domain-containing protein n=1 Tax=Streptomyces polygonati TaxID=1617087 RepID=A0ABV8HDD7_9ACTN